MRSNELDGMANSVNLNQTAPELSDEQSDLCLYVFSNAMRTRCSVISGIPELHPVISQWKINFKKCNPPYF